MPGWTDFQLNMGFKLDIMTSVKGLEEIGFEECYNFAVIAEIEGVMEEYQWLKKFMKSTRARTARPRK